jgi:hypothetical protein
MIGKAAFASLVVACLLTATGSAPAAAASGIPPFAVTASSGPQAGAHIIATVTRGGVTLPAALVPALKPGDVVDVDFPDYRRPPNSINYHVNVAFITEAAPQHWLYERSTREDQLFANGRAARKSSPHATGHIHFVYGEGTRRGIPIFFIIPEDAKTRGVDGVRDYVDAHPSDFVAMSASTNAAVDRYSFLSDFLTSLGNGAIDPSTSRGRIESIAQSFGVNPATIDGCYVTYTAATDVRNCVQQSIGAVVYQTNFSAPTQGQFLGGVAGALSPATYTPYLASLITVWRLFVHTGHQEYEYLPATVNLADTSGARSDELLLGLKVPTIRPPGPYSDVLFFTIGDPQATEHAPVVVNDAPAAGVCERTNRFSVPLHFDHTSRYVHDAALEVTGDGRPAIQIGLDPRSLAAPIVERKAFGTAAAFSVALHGRFGFDDAGEPAQRTMRIAFPSDAPWQIAARPLHPPIAGRDFDIVATSASAPCLSRAELQVGDAPPIALTATAIDDKRVQLHGSLTNVPSGRAHVHFFEDDGDGRTHAVEVPLPIAQEPAHVDDKVAAALGDTFVSLTGTGLEEADALMLRGVRYEKQRTSTSVAACFIGPAVGAGLVPGQRASAQLVGASGAEGSIFGLTISPARPHLAAVRLAAPAAGTLLSTAPIALTLIPASDGPFPLPSIVRIRKAPAHFESACATAGADATSATLPDAAVHPRADGTLEAIVAPDILHDLAFGTLEVQVVDKTTGLGSVWTQIPATFARAPQITQIVCPIDASAPCRMYGQNLATIAAVRDAAGAFVVPSIDCPPTEKGIPCVGVPRVASYVLRLADEGAIETLPGALITSAPR